METTQGLSQEQSHNRMRVWTEVIPGWWRKINLILEILNAR